ncbi:MAG TPA: hypothetical protein VGF39_01395, partial [Stellaceae bacterium]
RVDELAVSWASAIWIGHNSLRFDEEMVRHSLYGALRRPYATQSNGNMRLDLLGVAHFLHAVEPEAIAVPRTESGRLTFSLGPLMEANGLPPNPAAHDALADSRATADMLRFIVARAPAAWRWLLELLDKRAIVRLLETSEFVLVVDRTRARAVAPIGRNPGYSNEWLGLDLSEDPAPLFGLPPEELGGHRRLRRLRINRMPLLVSPDHAVAARLVADLPAEVWSWARTVRADSERLATAATAQRAEYPSSPYVEDRLYEGGFFPLDADAGAIAEFHRADPADKPAFLGAMRDRRARQLGRRILYNECPEVLSAECLAKMDQGRLARMHTADAPWTTVPKALAAIDQLMPAASPPIARMLEEYGRYLDDEARRQRQESA